MWEVPSFPCANDTYAGIKQQNIFFFKKGLIKGCSFLTCLKPTYIHSFNVGGKSHLNLTEVVNFSAFSSFLVTTSSAAPQEILLEADNNNNVDVTHPEFMLHPVIFFTLRIQTGNLQQRGKYPKEKTAAAISHISGEHQGHCPGSCALLIFTEDTS